MEPVPQPSAADSVDRVLAIVHSPAAPHVAVIGRRTLSFVLALMNHGCGCVRSLRPDSAAPDCETADLAWIVDVQDEHELDDALRAAHRRTGDKGRIVLEDAACRHCATTVRQHALAAGLDVLSFDHVARRLVLAPLPRLAMAA